MGAETETVVKYLGASKPGCDLLRRPDLVSIDLTPSSQLNVKSVEENSEVAVELEFVPSVRSGSYADIGPRRYMEDEHICIDDLSLHLSDEFPQPSAFYGVFDGHGGPEAAAFMKKHAMRLFFEDFKLPNTSECDNHVDESLRRAFQAADLAIADDPTVHASSGTTALTALLLGRVLVVANAGDCRAVLCRKGEAVEMSSDHRPIYPAERRRVVEAGGFVDGTYLNGVVAVSRALGDWDMKQPRGSKSPLISEPELRRETLTEDDEFLIMGCDGVWDVMSSQQAVTLVRRSLRRHDDPQQCAKDLLSEALRLGTFDNLTVLVVCFTPPDASTPPPQHRRLRCCTLSTDALCTLKSLLDGGR